MLPQDDIFAKLGKCMDPETLEKLFQRGMKDAGKRRGKKAGDLGSGGSQAAGSPVRPF